MVEARLQSSLGRRSVVTHHVGADDLDPELAGCDLHCHSGASMSRYVSSDPARLGRHTPSRAPPGVV